jgi:hypothetical protein
MWPWPNMNLALTCSSKVPCPLSLPDEPASSESVSKSSTCKMSFSCLKNTVGVARIITCVSLPPRFLSFFFFFFFLSQYILKASDLFASKFAPPPGTKFITQLIEVKACANTNLLLRLYVKNWLFYFVAVKMVYYLHLWIPLFCLLPSFPPIPQRFLLLTLLTFLI